MKIVTICGSMKFENEMKKVAFILETKHDMSVLQCVYNEDKLELGEDEIAALNSAHLKKIELADAVYVVDLHGYIGEQVKKEIAFARKLPSSVKRCMIAISSSISCGVKTAVGSSRIRMSTPR